MPEIKKIICIKVEDELKIAAQAEAKRRRMSVTQLIKNYLENFLPENIDESIFYNNQTK